MQEITMENIENNAKRMMTVVCEEESEFMVLDKEDYVNNGLDVLQQQEFQVRLRFFQWATNSIRFHLLLACFKSYCSTLTASHLQATLSKLLIYRLLGLLRLQCMSSTR